VGRGVLFLKIAVVIVLAVAFQGLLPRYWESFHFVDLPLIVTVYCGLMRDPMVGMLVGFFAGLGGDLAPSAGHVEGVGGFSKTLIGYLIASVGVRIPLEGPFTRILVLGLSSLANSFLFIGLQALLDQDVTGFKTPGDVARMVGFATAANLVFGVFIFWMFDKLFPESAPQGQLRVRRRFYD
jgi:rod shape-determining protein MreD